MKARQKAELYRELAKLTAADFHFDRSVELLLKQGPTQNRRRLLQKVRANLAAGQGVAEAMASAEAPRITRLEASMIEAGERSGRLGQSFAHLSQYFAAADAARREAWRGMQYPLVLLHLAILLPEIPAAVARPEVANPVPKIAVSIALVWLAIGIGAWVWRRLAAAAEHSASLDRCLGLLPFVGRVRRHWALARFAQVFHASLLAALNMSKSVRLAGEAAQSGSLRAAAARAADQVEKGEQVASALAATRAFPSDFIAGLATAEEVGGLDVEMGRWAEVETAHASDAIQRASVWLPKIGYAAITVYVVYRIYQMVDGYYGELLRQFDA